MIITFICNIILFLVSLLMSRSISKLRNIIKKQNELIDKQSKYINYLKSNQEFLTEQKKYLYRMIFCHYPIS